MAAPRENQGLQAALIIFVMITIGLGASTYFTFRSAEESDKLLEAKKAEADDFKKKYTDRDIEVRCLKFMLGWDTTLSDGDYDGLIRGLPESAEIHQIDQGFKQDMAMYGKGLDKPNYRLVPAELLKVIKAKNDALVVSVEKRNEIQAQLDQARKDAQQEIQTAKKAQEDASSELVKRTGDFETERNRLNQEKTDIQTSKDKLASDLNSAKSDIEKLEKRRQDDIVKITRQKDNVQSELDRYQKHENFEVPDGQITYVNQRLNTVLINLGSADGLRAQVSFSVYDKGENSATKAEKKAGIEVIRLLEPHVAEARIVYSETANPILPGDQIYSPVWTVNRRLRFALTGFMDIDGDGENDRQKVRNLILLNGGIIDAEQQDDGAVDTNKMTLQTRYLVVGDLPSERNSLDAHLQGRNRMIKMAEDVGIDQVPVQELLEYMGWRGEERTQALGRGATGTGSNPSGSGEYRSRQPPARGGNGAF